ncbi:hypothetical protein GCM10027062_03530 [Nocardioides hungaricus]
MYGDTTAIRALARRLRERADEIRDLAADLSTRADSVPWTGLAADAMRAHASGRVHALLRTAALHDEAAEAVERHAREVDRRTDLLDDLKGLLT